MTDQPTSLLPQEPRRLLGGRYELGALLGRGGMAEVHRGRDMRLNRDVAIKQLRIDLATDSVFQERFRREAQAAANLNHPNIVAVYDTGDDPDPATGVRVPYIVMELVEGHTLREILRTGRQIQPAKALEFTQGVLDALAYSHRAGIVHRDIKPANVMLTTQGVVKVMDFGIARAVADTSSTMTQTAAVIGTAQYLSPEQARGETVDARSDLYSTGCLLYELLTGRPPFQGDSPVSVAYQHVREQPIPPSQLDPMITPGMDAVVLKALAKDPNERYQTAGAMRADIARLLAGQDVAIRPPMTVALPAVSAAATQVVPAMAAAPVEPDNATLAQSANASRAVETPPNRRIGLWVFVIALVVILLAIGGYFLIAHPFANQVPMIPVPNVNTMTEAQAKSSLQSVNLVVNEIQVQGPDDDTVGHVTDQDPIGGTQVKPGTTVTIKVNIGPTKQPIPVGLIQQNYKTAVAALNRMGFTNVTSMPDPAESTDYLTFTAGQVTQVNPQEGTAVDPTTQITVYYATGMSSVPNVYGVPEATAKSILGNAGFKNVKTVTKEDATATPGSVTLVAPDVGTNADRTKPVTLTIATAPPPPPTTPAALPSTTDTNAAPGDTGANQAGAGTNG